MRNYSHNKDTSYCQYVCTDLTEGLRLAKFLEIQNCFLTVLETKKSKVKSPSPGIW